MNEAKYCRKALITIYTIRTDLINVDIDFGTGLSDRQGLANT